MATRQTTGQAWDRESSLVKDRRSPTVPRNQHVRQYHAYNMDCEHAMRPNNSSNNNNNNKKKKNKKKKKKRICIERNKKSYMRLFGQENK